MPEEDLPPAYTEVAENGSVSVDEGAGVATIRQFDTHTVRPQGSGSTGTNNGGLAPPITTFPQSSSQVSMHSHNSSVSSIPPNPPHSPSSSLAPPASSLRPPTTPPRPPTTPPRPSSAISAASSASSMRPPDPFVPQIAPQSEKQRFDDNVAPPPGPPPGAHSGPPPGPPPSSSQYRPPPGPPPSSGKHQPPPGPPPSSIKHRPPPGPPPSKYDRPSRPSGSKPPLPNGGPQPWPPGPPPMGPPMGHPGPPMGPPGPMGPPPPPMGRPHLQYPPNFFCKKCHNTGIKVRKGTSCQDCWDRFGVSGQAQYIPSGMAPVFSGPPRVVRPGDPSIGGLLCGRCRGRGVISDFLFESSCPICHGVGRVF